MRSHKGESPESDPARDEIYRLQNKARVKEGSLPDAEKITREDGNGDPHRDILHKRAVREKKEEKLDSRLGSRVYNEYTEKDMKYLYRQFPDGRGIDENVLRPAGIGKPP